MKHLSQEQIQNLALIIELNGRVALRCDGYQVDLFIGEVTQFRPAKTTEVINIYVNKRLDVKWCNYACEESKFLMPIIVDGNKTLYYPYFYTARAALEHINAASDNVELLRTQNSSQWRNKATC